MIMLGKATNHQFVDLPDQRTTACLNTFLGKIQGSAAHFCGSFWVETTNIFVFVPWFLPFLP